MTVRGSGHSHIGGQVCPRPSPREDAQWLHCPRTRAAGNPPVPEEAGEIILISLCHLGTKGDRGDKKEGGTQHMGRGGQGVPWWGLPRERCQDPRSLSGDLQQRCANPGGGGGCQLLSDFRSSPQRGPLGFSRIHRAPVAQKGEDALGLVVASPGARTPSPKAFADRAGLRGPGTLFVEAVAFLLGQM